MAARKSKPKAAAGDSPRSRAENALAQTGEAQAFVDSTDKRRKALDKASAVAQHYVEKKAKNEEKGDAETRIQIGYRIRRGDKEALHSLAFAERDEKGAPRPIVALMDEALELLFASRNIDVEALGFKPNPAGYRAATLQLLASKKRKA